MKFTKISMKFTEIGPQVKNLDRPPDNTKGMWFKARQSFIKKFEQNSSYLQHYYSNDS